MTWKVLACPKSSRINGEELLRELLANPGSLGKWPLKRYVCVCVCVCCMKALLHAISKRLLDAVRTIIDHPNYSSQETNWNSDARAVRAEKYQYSPDITPLMLAAHM